MTQYEYNGNLKLTKVTYADGGELIHEYDDMDRVIKTTDPEGHVTTFLYDPAGRLVCKTLPDGNQYCYIYDAVGNVLEEGISKVELDFSEGLDALQAGFAAYGKITRTYDPNGNILTQTDQNGLTTFEYDSMNRVVKKTAANGGITCYTYSLAGDLLTVTDPLNHTVTYTYDAYGNKVTMTDPKGNITSYAYDANNNLIRTTDAFGTVQYEYDACNQLVMYEDQDYNQTTFGYDAAGRRTTVTDPMDHTVTTAYDAVGNVVSITDAKDNVIRSVTYNSRNLPATMADGTGEFTYTYDLCGKLVSALDYTSATYKDYTYDSMGRMVSALDEEGRVSNVTYHALGKPSALLGPTNAGTTYTYDDYGRVLTETIASGATKIYTYNEMGLVATVTNARNQVHQYTYDPAGRLVSLATPEGTVTYLYDDNGNVLSVTDAKGTRTYTYDALNRVTSYTDAQNHTIQYQYESRGKLERIIYPDNTAVGYTYDERNNLIMVTDWNDRNTRYYYDENGNLISIENANSITTDVEYDDFQRMISWQNLDTDYRSISGYSLDKDGRGRVVREIQQRDEIGLILAINRSIEYNYDETGWVTYKGVTDDQTQITAAETFSYDMAGNVEETESVYDGSNRLIVYQDDPVTYDADGNMLSATIGGVAKTFAYDSRNRLISAGGIVNEYDPQGLRISSVADEFETTYVYDPNARLTRLLMKTTDDVTTKYVYGLGLIGEETDGEFKTYHYDYRGSTVAITDEGENITDTFEYDTYGKLLSHDGSTETPFLYNGRDGVMTEPNGLYYMRNRFYSPDLKRFINPDLLAGDITNAITLNRYAYANNNPVSFVDPLGLSAERGIDKIGSLSSDDVYAIVYSYEYYVGFGPWKYKKTGYVYFFRNVDKTYFESESFVYPKEFNEDTDLLVADLTDYENPNLYAYQAHKIAPKHRAAIIDLMQRYDDEYDTPWERTDESLMVEWECHDIFSPFDKSAQDIDFDNNEEEFGYIDYFEKAAKRGIKKIFN